MIVLCAEKSWTSYGDCPGSESAIAVLKPVATFSTMRKAKAFANKFEDDYKNPYVNWEYITVPGNLPNDPADIRKSVINKVSQMNEDYSRR